MHVVSTGWETRGRVDNDSLARGPATTGRTPTALTCKLPLSGNLSPRRTAGIRLGYVPIATARRACSLPSFIGGPQSPDGIGASARSGHPWLETLPLPLHLSHRARLVIPVRQRTLGSRCRKLTVAPAARVLHRQESGGLDSLRAHLARPGFLACSNGLLRVMVGSEPD